MDYITVTAKNLDDAITEALVQLEVTSDRLDYEVIEKGSDGFLGFGRKQAVIKARRKEEPVVEVKAEKKEEKHVKVEKAAKFKCRKEVLLSPDELFIHLLYKASVHPTQERLKILYSVITIAKNVNQSQSLLQWVLFC